MSGYEWADVVNRTGYVLKIHEERDRNGEHQSADVLLPAGETLCVNLNAAHGGSDKITITREVS